MPPDLSVTCAPWQCPACSCGYGLPSCRRASPPQQQGQACQTPALVTSANVATAMMAGFYLTPATVTGKNYYGNGHVSVNGDVQVLPV